MIIAGTCLGEQFFLILNLTVGGSALKRIYERKDWKEWLPEGFHWLNKVAVNLGETFEEGSHHIFPIVAKNKSEGPLGRKPESCPHQLASRS